MLAACLIDRERRSSQVVPRVTVTAYDEVCCREKASNASVEQKLERGMRSKEF
jgi:hypothetical protein